MSQNKALTGHSEFAQKMCEMLGLPKHVRAFTLRCAVDEVVTLEVEYYPTEDGMNVPVFEPIVGTFNLVPANGGPPKDESTP